MAQELEPELEPELERHKKMLSQSLDNLRPYLEPEPELEPKPEPEPWHFFLSHTQRDDGAKLLATEIFHGLEKLGYRCWLDVKMSRCDELAM
jgi:hypothetical protein